MSANLEMLFHEAEEARLQETLLEATGEDILDKARHLAEAIEERVRQATAEKEPDADPRPSPNQAGAERPARQRKPQTSCRPTWAKGQFLSSCEISKCTR
jgi:predicted RNA-binding Zn ribbon-like protein